MDEVSAFWYALCARATQIQVKPAVLWTALARSGFPAGYAHERPRSRRPRDHAFEDVFEGSAAARDIALQEGDVTHANLSALFGDEPTRVSRVRRRMQGRGSESDPLEHVDTLPEKAVAQARSDLRRVPSRAAEELFDFVVPR